MSNGLYQRSYTRCKICSRQSDLVSGSPAEAQRDLRKLGWRPERIATLDWTSEITGKEHFIFHTVWYCPYHEQLRPSLKRNQKGAAQ